MVKPYATLKEALSGLHYSKLRYQKFAGLDRFGLLWFNGLLLSLPESP
jgi:hypothetical protein